MDIVHLWRRDGAMHGVLFIDDISYSALVSGESNKLSVYGSSYMGLKNSTVNSKLQISTGSVGNIESSIINKPENEYHAVSIDRNSYSELKGKFKFKVAL